MTARRQEIVEATPLDDLAARIRAEHQAAAAVLERGLQHAITAGRLLIEAKAQTSHGGWIAWLKNNCEMSLRTAQAYMRVASAIGKDDSKAQRVAHLTFRDALNELAEGSHYQRAIKHVAAEERRASFTLETAPAMLPSPAGRKINVTRTGEREWMLELGPTVSRADMLKKIEAARDSETIRPLQEELDAISKQAEALEVQAKRLRKLAKTLESKIESEVRKTVGPEKPFVERRWFECDDATNAEMKALPTNQRIERLLAARRSDSPPIRNTSTFYGGDIQFLTYAFCETPK